MSGYQLAAFEIGQIKAHVYHGLGAAQIARIFVKADGKHIGVTLPYRLR